MIGELYELRMGASDIAELGRTKLWKVCLYILALFSREIRIISYVDIKSQYRIFPASALEAGNFCL